MDVYAKDQDEIVSLMEDWDPLGSIEKGDKQLFKIRGENRVTWFKVISKEKDRIIVEVKGE